MTCEDLETLINSGEADRVELTRAAQDTEKFREAICSFSNDMAGHDLPGYLIIGIDEKDADHRPAIQPGTMEKITALRSDGAILPLPKMSVCRMEHPKGSGEVIVVKVLPHDLPPVRVHGRIHIRVGPRKDTASEAEERVLIERRAASFPTFDARPCPEGDTARLDLEAFRQTYRPEAVDAEVIAASNRSIEQQLAALRFYNTRRDCPTNAGMLVFAYDPLDVFPGAKVQFVQFAGTRLDTEVLAEKEFTGSLITVLRELDAFLKGRFTSKPIEISALKEDSIFDFHPIAVKELLMNAILHRDYQSTSPTRLYQFSDRIEIQNPGGLYGEASPENFPRVNAYRNPIIGEAMKVLGFVNRFGRGIARAKKASRDNRSPVPNFEYKTSHFLAIIPKHPQR